MIPYKPKKHKNVDIYEIKDRRENGNIITYVEKVTNPITLEAAKKHPSHFWVNEEDL